jgi:hypothetical protein
MIMLSSRYGQADNADCKHIDISVDADRLHDFNVPIYSKSNSSLGLSLPVFIVV